MAYAAKNTRYKESLAKLLEAQSRGLRVSIEEGGVIGETVGRISDVCVENGKLKFKIEGQTYDAFHRISVRLLN